MRPKRTNLESNKCFVSEILLICKTCSGDQTIFATTLVYYIIIVAQKFSQRHVVSSLVLLRCILPGTSRNCVWPKKKMPRRGGRDGESRSTQKFIVVPKIEVSWSAANHHPLPRVFIRLCHPSMFLAQGFCWNLS